MYIYIYKVCKYVIKTFSNFYIYIYIYLYIYRRYSSKQDIVMVSYCVDLLASLYLLLCLQVFIISVLLFKRLHSFYVAISFLIET